MTLDELNKLPKWRQAMLLGALFVFCGIGYGVAKLFEVKDSFVEMTTERKRMLVNAERESKQLLSEEL